MPGARRQGRDGPTQVSPLAGMRARDVSRDRADERAGLRAAAAEDRGEQPAPPRPTGAPRPDGRRPAATPVEGTSRASGRPAQPS